MSPDVKVWNIAISFCSILYHYSVSIESVLFAYTRCRRETGLVLIYFQYSCNGLSTIEDEKEKAILLSIKVSKTASDIISIKYDRVSVRSKNKIPFRSDMYDNHHSTQSIFSITSHLARFQRQCIVSSKHTKYLKINMAVLFVPNLPWGMGLCLLI